MVTTMDKAGEQICEPEKLVEEFRQKIIYSLQKEKDLLRESVNKDAKLILTKAYQESSEVTAKAREDAKDIVTKAHEQINKEMENTLAQAKQKAEQIMREAEETAHKEAREKTRKEIDSLLRVAREDAIKQNTKTLQSAKDEANSIIQAAKKEGAALCRKFIDEAEKGAAEITRSATEMKLKAAEELGQIQRKTAEAVEQALASARKIAVEKADKEATDIVTQAKTLAQKEREQLLSAALSDAKNKAEEEKIQILAKANREAEQIINIAREKVHSQIDESSRLMLEIQQKMSQVIGTAGSMVKPREQPTTESADRFSSIGPEVVHNIETQPISNSSHPAAMEKAGPPALPTQTKASSLLYNAENQTYEGRLKIDIAPPADNEQIVSLDRYLRQKANIQVVSKGGAEDGSAWIEVEMSHPAKLLDVLRDMPLVKDVVGAKSYVIVALRSKQPI